MIEDSAVCANVKTESACNKDKKCDWKTETWCDSELVQTDDTCEANMESVLVSMFGEKAARQQKLCSSSKTQSACMTVTAAPDTKPVTKGKCLSWCASSKKSWDTKCSWETSCSSCRQCDETASVTVPVATCPSWCSSKQQKWKKKCTWAECTGCSQCTGSDVATRATAVTTKPGACPSWCGPSKSPWSAKCKWKTSCGKCPECIASVTVPVATCPSWCS